MNPYLSQKIKNLSFLLMGMVAFIHGYNINLRFSDGEFFQPSYWLRFLEGFLSDGVCRVAVPMFFAISGYLATQSLGKEGIGFSSYGILIRKRVYSLLVPYLLVSGLGIITVTVLQLIPFSRPFFNNFNLDQTTPGQWLRIWLFSPVPYQLWFIRFLIFYFLLYPAAYFLARYFKVVYLVGMVYFWSCYECQQQFGLYKIEVEGMLFFSVGIFASVVRLDLMYRPPVTWVLAGLVFWFGWVAYRTYLSLRPDIDHYAVHHHLIGFVLVGFILFWFSYDSVAGWLKPDSWLTRQAPFSIGVFLFHEPALTIIKKILIRVGSNSDLTLFLAYIFTPILGFWFGLIFSRLFYSYFPAGYALFTGNRKPA